MPGGESESPAKLPDLELEDSIRERNDMAADVELDESPAVGAGVNGPEEVELNEPAEIGSAAPAPHRASATLEEKDDPPLAGPTNRAWRAGPLGAPDPAGLRAMLADQPELLEPGLSVYKSEKGTPLGARYTSAVGEIDLLATDADGGLVVVMVVEPHEGPELIAGVLQRIGWVRKHLSGRSQSVRGIVLMDHARDSVAYAAAAVAGTVAFKTYQVALTFDDLQF
jgi:hypothetical protein